MLQILHAFRILVLIGSTILIYQTPDLHAVARLPNPNPVYLVTVVSAGFGRFPTTTNNLGTGHAGWQPELYYNTQMTVVIVSTYQHTAKTQILRVARDA